MQWSFNVIRNMFSIVDWISTWISSFLPSYITSIHIMCYIFFFNISILKHKDLFYSCLMIETLTHSIFYSFYFIFFLSILKTNVPSLLPALFAIDSFHFSNKVHNCCLDQCFHCNIVQCCIHSYWSFGHLSFFIYFYSFTWFACIAILFMSYVQFCCFLYVCVQPKMYWICLCSSYNQRQQQKQLPFMYR